MDRMRHHGHADLIFQRRGECALGEGRIVIGVNDVVRDAGMGRDLGEQLFQDGAGRKLVLVGLVQRIGRGKERKRIEDPRFAVVGMVLRDGFHFLGIGERARAVVELVAIGVEDCERLDVIAFTRRFAGRRARLLDRLLANLETGGLRRRPELIPHAHGEAPMRHRAIGIALRDRREFLACLLVPEGVQRRERSVEARLHSAPAGGREYQVATAPLHQRVGIVLRKGVLMGSEKNARGGAKGISQHTYARGSGLSSTGRAGDHRDPRVGCANDGQGADP
jgi:hypothetical protein